MQTQNQIIESLPVHLRPFVATQDYTQYSPRDQAVWRFLLHQLKADLTSSAHPTYIDGLVETGIGLEEIPRIEDINACLNQLGWCAVVVDGFLPPAIFMEFQALKILAIAVNIRSFEHMLYTPAPDIIHESAGHAPFLIDIDYAEFLQRFGELGMQAISNQHDMNIYEAVRQLSIVKERTDSSTADINKAQELVETLQDTKVTPSEANLLARLHWWTVEYGLVGDVNNYTIFGAGLLSSLSESQSCLDDTKVNKKALTVNAVDLAYDITVPQPQLFVTESCRHLSQVLDEFGQHMCCYRGGASALEEAYQAQTVNTVTLNSGMQVSGKVSRIISDAVGNAVYFNTEGGTQLSFKNTELYGHGINTHAQGFGSPIGKLRAIERCLSWYTVDGLKLHNIEVDQHTTLNFLSGITVKGVLKKIVRKEQKNILLCFKNCTVIDMNGEILFDPEWGDYDMAVGDAVTAVFGGSADQSTFPLYEAPSEKVTIAQSYDQHTQEQLDWYHRLRDCRVQLIDNSKAANEHVLELLSTIAKLDDCDWLLTFESLELAQIAQIDSPLMKVFIERLNDEGGDAKTLIDHGLRRLGLSESI